MRTAFQMRGDGWFRIGVNLVNDDVWDDDKFSWSEWAGYPGIAMLEVHMDDEVRRFFGVTEYYRGIFEAETVYEAKEIQ